MAEEKLLPALDELVSICRLARVLEADPTRHIRHAMKGYIPVQKVGNYWVTILWQVLEAETAGMTRGKRGPAPKPLPELVLWANGD